MLGHVKDFGGDYADANVRGYQTSARMSFHSDQSDYVALMCVQPSRSGGVSLIASTVTIYNEMLKTCPELAGELIAEFHQTRHGEVPPGEKPWYKLPVFSFHEGYFSARGAGVHALKAQGLPGVRHSPTGRSPRSMRSRTWPVASASTWISAPATSKSFTTI